MRIGLVSYRCENRNIPFNIARMEKALEETAGRADLLCFGEAFLQGFDSLCWDFETDRKTAVEQTSGTMDRLRRLTQQYGTGLLFGYIEREGDFLYSSCAVMDHGELIRNYRRISPGWKEIAQADGHYREGTETESFLFRGREMKMALCGDLYDSPERFRTEGLLIWPVYLNYTVTDWDSGVLEEYAAQAALAARCVLAVNPIDHDPVSHGGAWRFQDGRAAERLPFDEEGILLTDIG